ncbi:MAG: BRO family protein [Catenulispora sp.]
MSTLTPFTFPATGEPVRTILIDGEPWIVAADVTAILGYANGRDAVSRLPERMKGVGSTDTPGGRQKLSIINEPGVYRLAMRSNLPEAERFQDWLSEEVLPSIRKTGGYGVPAPRELSRLELIELARDAEIGRLEAETRIAELEPAAAAWENLASANGDYSVADAAKVLSRDPAIQIGRDRLFTVMYKLGWTYRGGDGRWRIKQTAVETGRLSELPSSHYHPRTGELVLDPPQVRVTVKGVHDLHRALGPKALVAS